MLSEKDYLLAKSDGVKDCVKFIEKEIKEKRKTSDYADPVELKVSLDKYRKKLRYQANEAEWNAKPAHEAEQKEQYPLSSQQMVEMMALLNENKVEDVKGLLQDMLNKAGHADAKNN